jgi:PAS domain S-box-containing protein
MSAFEPDLSVGLQDLTPKDEVRRGGTVVGGTAGRHGPARELPPIGDVVTDLYGVVVEANLAAVELLGLPGERLSGKPFVTFVELEDRRAFRRLLLRAGADRAVHGCELSLISRNGTSFAAEVVVIPPPAAEPETLRLTIRDVREQKARDVELRALTQDLEQRVAERTGEIADHRLLLAEVLDQIPLGLLLADAPSGRVFMVNEAARSLGADTTLGRVADYPAGRRPDGSPVAPHEWPLARAVVEGATVPAEIIEFELPTGTTLLYEVTASPIRNARGDVIAGVALIEDVAERERVDAAERDFIANAAHELQTPVTAITNAVEALRAGAEHDPPERERFLSHLYRETVRLGRLSNALLTLARVERSGEPPRLELLPLEPLLREAADTIPPAEGVEVVVTCDADVALLTHRDLFLQVLTSLGTNAARNTASGRIELRARLTGTMRVAVEISDTGVGIAAEHHEHVFRRFYRAETVGSGTGLGLAIALQATQALGGRLELASEPGRGTTLAMNLPGARLIS